MFKLTLTWDGWNANISALEYKNGKNLNDSMLNDDEKKDSGIDSIEPAEESSSKVNEKCQ